MKQHASLDHPFHGPTVADWAVLGSRLTIGPADQPPSSPA